LEAREQTSLKEREGIGKEKGLAKEMRCKSEGKKEGRALDKLLVKLTEKSRQQQQTRGKNGEGSNRR